MAPPPPAGTAPNGGRTTGRARAPGTDTGAHTGRRETPGHGAARAGRHRHLHGRAPGRTGSPTDGFLHGRVPGRRVQDGSGPDRSALPGREAFRAGPFRAGLGRAGCPPGAGSGRGELPPGTGPLFPREPFRFPGRRGGRRRAGGPGGPGRTIRRSCHTVARLFPVPGRGTNRSAAGGAPLSRALGSWVAGASRRATRDGSCPDASGAGTPAGPSPPRPARRTAQRGVQRVRLSAGVRSGEST